MIRSLESNLLRAALAVALVGIALPADAAPLRATPMALQSTAKPRLRLRLLKTRLQPFGKASVSKIRVQRRLVKHTRVQVETKAKGHLARAEQLVRTAYAEGTSKPQRKQALDQAQKEFSKWETQVRRLVSARELDSARVNEAFVWTARDGAIGAHTKQCFPDEEGYYEARWFERGERNFRVVSAGDAKVGFLLCTEIMFNEHARRYGRNGAQLILSPRAVGKASLPRWLVAMRMAAIVSGCYVLTSNRGGTDSKGQLFGGCGWVIDPEGELVAQTSRATPIVFHEIDTDYIARAQKEYPCYVKE